MKSLTVFSLIFQKVAESMEQMAKDSPLTDALINFPFHWFLSAACEFVEH